MSGHTFPFPQRHIIFSGDFDKWRFRNEKTNRSLTGFENAWVQLYAAPSERYDMKVDSGDLLFTVDHFNRSASNKRRRFAVNQQQHQPLASSSFNGLQAPRNLYDKVMGMDHDSKVQNVVDDTVTFIGVALTSYVHDGTDDNQKQGLAILCGGMHHVLNNSMKDIHAMELIGWKAPKPGDKQFSDTADQGHSETRILPHIQAMDGFCSFTVESLCEWFNNKFTEPFENMFKPGVKFPDEAKLISDKEIKSLFQEQMVALAVDDCSSEYELWKSVVIAIDMISYDDKECAFVMKSWVLFQVRQMILFMQGEACEVADLFDGLFSDRRDETIAGINIILAAIKMQWLKNGRKLIGKVIRGGNPGSRLDVLLG